MSKADETTIRHLIEENLELRENIRALIKERIDTETYWKNFALKLIEK